MRLRSPSHLARERGLDTGGVPAPTDRRYDAGLDQTGADTVAAAGSKKAKEKTIDLEKALGELETLVDDLERGDLPLDKALAHFERGVALTRDCEAALTAAEQKVALLMSDAGIDDTPKALDDEEDAD